MIGLLSGYLHSGIIRVCMGSGSLNLQASSSAARMGIPGDKVDRLWEDSCCCWGLEMMSEAESPRIYLRMESRLHKRRMPMSY